MPGCRTANSCGGLMPVARVGVATLGRSIDDDRVAHAHLLVQAGAAMGGVGAGAGDGGDAARGVPRKLDLAVGRGARRDPRGRKETRRGEIMTAARAVHEVERDRLAGAKIDGAWTEAEIVDVDGQLGGG